MKWFHPLLLFVGIGLVAYCNTGQVPFYFDDISCSSTTGYYWVPFDALGDIRWNLGLYAQTAADYGEALRQGNSSRQLLIKLGRAQCWSGQTGAAWMTFSSILADNPGDGEALAEMQALQR